jgi:hypothetical protein
MKYFFVLASMMIIHFTLLHFDREKEIAKPPAAENTKKNACNSQAFDHFLRFFRFSSSESR